MSNWIFRIMLYNYIQKIVTTGQLIKQREIVIIFHMNMIILVIFLFISTQKIIY